MGELFKVIGECWVELFLLKFWGEFEGDGFNVHVWWGNFGGVGESGVWVQYLAVLAMVVCRVVITSHGVASTSMVCTIPLPVKNLVSHYNTLFT